MTQPTISPIVENEMGAALIEKGFVPHIQFDGTTGNMTILRWGPPHTEAYHMGFPEAFVLVGLLLFILCLVKGVPWA